MPARTADLAERFAELDRIVQNEPEGSTAQIAVGVFHMTPRGTFGHAYGVAALATRIGPYCAARSDEWLFLLDAEIRSVEAASRVVPDCTVWRQSKGGWPKPDENPFSTPPFWAAEVLSPTTEEFDRGPKLAAYGLMGVAWVWLVDVKKRRIEVYENDAGKLVHRETREAGDRLDAPPFE
ncbi:MAG TPA: Uma2 family endonuclease, partial [Thermoanaerobaculia bacterium]